jgi:hypothetical protein
MEKAGEVQVADGVVDVNLLPSALITLISKK